MGCRMAVNPAILPEVSAKIHEAQTLIDEASVLLRENGFAESAADLSLLNDPADFWIKPDGFLHWLAQPDHNQREAAK